MKKIRVSAFWKESKRRYFLKWKDPATGKTKTRQTEIDRRGARNDRIAARLARDLEGELNSPYGESTDMSWEDFRVTYARDRLGHTSQDNRNKWKAAAAIFDEVWPKHVLGVLRLSQVNPRLLLAVEAEMRKRLSEGSVPSYAATLRAGFSWAAKMGLMPMLPPRPPEVVEQTLPAMRLVPIAMESLERMEAAAKSIVGKRHAKGIKDYLWCLWLSGCRLSDPVWMHSFRLDCHHPITLEGDRPMFGWVSRQKNKRDQIARVTLDFAAWAKPRCESRDWLVNPTCEHGRLESKHALSAIISDIGERANVVAEPGDPPVTATAKHFRSSFVTRWSRRGMPIQEVSAMVRHGSVKTTEKYYLAPPTPEMMTSFTERDWFGDQVGDQQDDTTSENTANLRGDGGIRTHE